MFWCAGRFRWDECTSCGFRNGTHGKDRPLALIPPGRAGFQDILWVEEILHHPHGPNGIRYPSSTLFPFYMGVSLLKLNSRKKGYPHYFGLTGEPRGNYHPDPLNKVRTIEGDLGWPHAGPI